MSSPEQAPASPDELYEGHANAAEYARLADEYRTDRGDRLLPGEPDRGFDVPPYSERLLQEPVSIAGAFPLSYRGLNPDPTGIDRWAAGYLAPQIIGGEVPVVERVDGEPPESETDMTLRVVYPIEKKAYEAAVAAGTIQPGLFRHGDLALGDEEGTGALAALVDPQQRQAALEEAIAEAGDELGWTYWDDFEELGTDELEELDTVLEVFELSDGGEVIRLVNCTKYHLTDEQLRKLTNAARSASDKSGGHVFESINTVMILPEGHSSLFGDARRKDGQTGKRMYHGFRRGRLIGLSDRLIKPVEDLAPPPALGPDEDEDDQYYQEGEPREGPGAPKYSVTAGDLELVAVHEFSHANIPSHMAVPELDGEIAPGIYGRTSLHEHTAELDTAEYAGGEDARAVPRSQRTAMQAIWARRRGLNKPLHDAPMGPRYVTCREVDLSRGPLTPRLVPWEPVLVTETVYQLV
ncbi:MAG TPA: hypothetical protein VHQ86_04760 [Candidatus Saccharimonadia bacterium]|nr:hypothetical protein [Candidatus Saccharimonadia bacterium]